MVTPKVTEVRRGSRAQPGRGRGQGPAAEWLIRRRAPDEQRTRGR
jgi:hypothetical protein